jgi:hypothetical protein
MKDLRPSSESRAAIDEENLIAFGAKSNRRRYAPKSGTYNNSTLARHL